MALLLFAALAVSMAGSSAVSQQTTPPPASTQPADSAIPADYIIGPEDVIGIVVWREAEISGDVVVRPDGRITVPVVGELTAAGLVPEQLRQQIVKHAGKYLNDPNVSVVVRVINSRKVFVTGRVTTPGTHALKGPLTVMQALALSGGLTEFADAKNVTILRKSGDQTVSLKFNYKDVAKGKNLAQNVLLQPGDTVVVP